jgi:hypothetical protein
MMKIATSVLLFLFSCQLLAKTTLSSFASTDYETVETTTMGIKIYAGRTNNSGTCTGTGTCNRCAGDPRVISSLAPDAHACGTKEVIAGNTISFVIRSDSTTLTAATATAAIRNTTTPGGVSVTASSSYAANSDLTISTTWANLCASGGGSASCDTSFLANFDVGYSTDSGSTVTEKIVVTIAFRYVDDTTAPVQSWECTAANANEGFCSFVAYPGDNKAYIDPTFNSANTSGVVTNLSGVGTSASDVSGIKYKALRVYYVLGSGPNDTQAAQAAAFTMDMSQYQDLSYTVETNTLTPKYVTGLTNQNPTTGDAYVLITGNVDQAGIVTYLSDPTSGAMCAGTFGDATQYFSNANGTQCVLPQNVSGLLDGQSCFIATATYGSTMAPEVDDFRKFRGEYLLKHSIGKEFVRFYYKHSPPIAAIIADNGFLRFISRIFLFPLLLFVKLTLAVGFLPGVIISIFALTTFAYYSRRLLRKEEN